MLKLGILISGRGSNMQALIAATQQAGFPASIACVISNEPDAKGLVSAAAAGIPTQCIAHKNFPDRQGFEAALDAKLTAAGVQLVCLAGFMRILTPWFVERWRDRLVNIHPSLLPAFPGLDTHQKVLDYGAKFTGCTVHYVRAEMDHGPIILQAVVPVATVDTAETLAERVLRAEHLAYPAAVRMIAEGRVNIHNEKSFIAGDAIPTEILYNPILSS